MLFLVTLLKVVSVEHCIGVDIYCSNILQYKCTFIVHMSCMCIISKTRTAVLFFSGYLKSDAPKNVSPSVIIHYFLTVYTYQHTRNMNGQIH